MKRLFAVLVCCAMTGLVARADNYIPDNFDLSDGHEEAISVASGDTDVYTDEGKFRSVEVWKLGCLDV